MSIFPGLDQCRDGHYSRTPLDTSLYTEVWMQLRRGRASGAAGASADRPDLEHLAVIAGFEGNPELAAAIVPGHDRRHGDDGFTAGVVERRVHARLLAKLDQVARGREWQLEAPALTALQRLAWRHPDRVGGFLAVMGADLFRRRGGEEEPGVEPFGHALRRDPVRIGHEFVERQHHSVIGQHLEEADLAVAELGAMRRLDFAGAFGIDQCLRALRPRQKDTAFLEGFADRGDTEAQRGLVEPLAARIQCRGRDDLLVALVDAAAGKHQRAGIEVDLIMADHHEDFDLLGGGAVAEQQDGGCGTRGDGFGHWTSLPRWIAVADWRGGRRARPATTDTRPRPLRLP